VHEYEVDEDENKKKKGWGNFLTEIHSLYDDKDAPSKGGAAATGAAAAKKKPAAPSQGKKGADADGLAGPMAGLSLSSSSTAAAVGSRPSADDGGDDEEDAAPAVRLTPSALAALAAKTAPDEDDDSNDDDALGGGDDELADYERELRKEVSVLRKVRGMCCILCTEGLSVTQLHATRPHPPTFAARSCWSASAGATAATGATPRGSAHGPSRASPSCPRAWPPGKKPPLPHPTTTTTTRRRRWTRRRKTTIRRSVWPRLSTCRLLFAPLPPTRLGRLTFCTTITTFAHWKRQPLCLLSSEPCCPAVGRRRAYMYGRDVVCADPF
jgi:hypothetical protein